MIAVEQRDVAERARADLVKARDAVDWHLPAQRELRAAMQSIAAAAFAIEGWAFASRGTPAARSLGSGGVMKVIGDYYEPPRDLRRQLRPRLQQLFDAQRGELVHHKSPRRDGKAHPLLGSTPYESATYTCEAATEACETLRLIVELCLQHPSPDRPPSRDAHDHARMVASAAGW